MRKLLTVMMAGATLAGLTVGLAGCSDETGTKEEVKIKGPEGTTTEKREIKIDKSGSNPPLAPSEKVKP
jgi:hypothetical protein